MHSAKVRHRTHTNVDMRYRQHGHVKHASGLVARHERGLADRARRDRRAVLPDQLHVSG